MTARSVLQLALIGALAAGAWTWKNSLQEKGLDPEPVSADVAGFYIRQGEIVAPSEDGSPLYHLVASRMAHGLGTDSIELTDIHLEYNHQSPDPWSMDAEHGRVQTDWNLIQLSGGVRMVMRTEENEPATLVTESMIVETDSHTARTDQTVTLELGDERLVGTGMKADLMAGRVQLESSVNGVFESRLR